MNYRFKYVFLVAYSIFLSTVIPSSPWRDGNRGNNFSVASAQTIESSNQKTQTDKLFDKGVELYRQGQYFKALEVYQQVLNTRREKGDKPGIAQTLNNIGEVYYWMSKGDKALKVLQQALSIRREIKDKSGEGETLDNIGLAYFRLNQNEKALEILRQALAIRQQLNNKAGEGKTLSNIGLVYSSLKQYSQALEHLQQALVIHEKVGDKFQKGITLQRLGAVYLDTKDYPRALEVYQKALTVNQEIGNPVAKAYALRGIGRIYYLQKKYNLAIENFQKALPIFQKLEISSIELFIIYSIGDTYLAQKKFEQAIKYYQQALPVVKKIKDKSKESFLLGVIANTYSSHNKYDQAIKYYQQALILTKETNNTGQTISYLESLGKNYFAQKQFEQAIKYYQQVLSLLKENQKPQKVTIFVGIGESYFAQNKLEQGEKYYQQAISLARELKNDLLEAGAIAKFISQYTDLAKQYNSAKEYQKAIEVANKGWEIAKKNQVPRLGIQVLMELFPAYENLSNYDKIIEVTQESLKITRNSKITQKEAELLKTLLKFQGNKYSLEEFNKMYDLAILYMLAKVYDITGEDKKAITYAEQVLTLARETKNNEAEANALLTLASSYSSLAFTAEEYQKSMGFAQQALKIARNIKSKELEAEALNEIAGIYSNLDEYQKAVETAKASLKLAEEIKDTAKIMQAKLTLAMTYLSLGEYDKFNQYSEEALTTARQIKEHPVFDAVALLFVMLNQFIQGDYQKTIDLAQEGLSISKNIGFSNYVKKFDVINLLFTGAGYAGLQDYEQAISYSQKSLELSRKINDRNLELYGLIFSGSFYKSAGQKQQAISSYRQALALASKTKIAIHGTYANIGIARVYRDLNQPNIAIAYYKKAINSFEEVRSNIKGLPKGIEESFLKSIQFIDRSKLTDIYRELAELLISQGRQAEAQQVLDLLKIQEIHDFAKDKKDGTKKPQVPLNDAEEKITTKSESIIALSRRISECDRTNCKEKSQLYDRRDVLITKFNKDLEEIEKEIRDRISNDPNTFRPDSPKAGDIVKSQPGTVMIYPLVMEDKLWLLMYSGNAAKKFDVKVSRNELGKTVKEFRRLMEECEKRLCGADDIAKIKPVSQKLYNWLIKPLEGELQQNKVKNLVFALDRVTRYVPMSALYDGKQYLIENYTIYNVLSAELTDTEDRLPTKIENTNVLAMGVSDAVGGFSALNNVPQEVDSIVRSSKTDKGVYPGKEYLNQSFDYKTLRDNLTGKNILHLATHGKFIPDSKKASYLLLGNGDKLAIPQIQNLVGLSDIHLVVLSACQTALASKRQDGVEIASLAYSFINRGAKSVIASLWQVEDKSTSELMQRFYTNIADNKPNQTITKAEAMRLAQLKLLHGKEFTIDDIRNRGIKVQPKDDNQPRTFQQDSGYSHPYYWSPFVLIGNGL